MASDLRIRVGGTTALLTFGGTDQQVADALHRFALSLGIPTEGNAQTQLMAIAEHIRDDIKRRSKAVQTTEKRAVADATITAEVDADNPI